MADIPEDAADMPFDDWWKHHGDECLGHDPMTAAWIAFEAGYWASAAIESSAAGAASRTKR